MKERHILFKPEMVQAILDGRKTKTRRVVKSPFPIKRLSSREEFCSYSRYPLNPDVDRHGFYFSVERPFSLDVIGLSSPYGKPGDRLWVREPWCAYGAFAKYKTGRVFYKADCPGGENPHGLSWKPSIHMPRWASRLTLEITDVRVERVQDITEADAMAEGDPMRGPIASENTHVDWFRSLWDSIHVKDGYEWDANPWAWVYTFKRVEP